MQGVSCACPSEISTPSSHARVRIRRYPPRLADRSEDETLHVPILDCRNSCLCTSSDLSPLMRSMTPWAWISLDVPCLPPAEDDPDENNHRNTNTPTPSSKSRVARRDCAALTMTVEKARRGGGGGRARREGLLRSNRLEGKSQRSSSRAHPPGLLPNSHHSVQSDTAQHASQIQQHPWSTR